MELIKSIAGRGTVEDALKYFEAELLRYGMIDKKLNEIRRGDYEHKITTKWYINQLMFVGFAVRGAILFLQPIFAPGNTFIPFILGDCIATLGLPLRQMWYALSVYYSIMCFIQRKIIKKAEVENRLDIMLDFAPGSPEVNHNDETLRIELNLAVKSYRIFKIVVFVSVYSQMFISLLLNTIKRKSVSYFIIDLIGLIYNA